MANSIFMNIYLQKLREFVNIFPMIVKVFLKPMEILLYIQGNLANTEKKLPKIYLKCF